MSDMHTARRAGGSSIPFTMAVVLVILLVIGGLVWRSTHSDSDLPEQTSTEHK